MKYALIMSCSSTRTVKPKVCVEDLHADLDMNTACEAWVNTLKCHKPDITPSELYRGRGFISLAKIRSEFVIDDTLIVTGGQGLINIDEKIVPYDFTANPKETHNITQKVTKEPFVGTVWWRKINELRKNTPTPVADYAKNNPDTFILIACSKLFLRYIADDVLSIPTEQLKNISILLSASSITSVPIQLRPYIVPFTKEAIADLTGNRNDGHHRAAYKFLSKAEQDESFLTTTNNERIEYFKSLSTDTTEQIAQVDLRQVFKDRPELLEMSSDAAYAIIRKEFGTIGGKMFFAGLFRELSGIQIKTTADEVGLAKDVLESMDFMATSCQASEEIEVLTDVKTFIEAIQSLSTSSNIGFTSSNIYAWAKKYYEVQNNTIPNILTSTQKITKLLKSNLDILNIEIAIVAGSKGFSVVSK